MRTNSISRVSRGRLGSLRGDRPPREESGVILHSGFSLASVAAAAVPWP